MAEPRAQTDIERLVLDHHQAIYRYAYRLAGETTEAEDLTQQTFLIAQQRLDQLRSPESARSWLLAILRSSFLKMRQRQRPTAATNVGLNLDSLPGEVEEDEPIDAARLQQAVGELPDEFRVVLAMFYFEECSYRDIAQQLDLPIGTVMSRLSRAKRHLRGKLFEREAIPRGPDDGQ